MGRFSNTPPKIPRAYQPIGLNPLPHLVLIDGPNYVFRAFYAIRQLANSRGEPTNAVYGYVQMVRGILAELKPTHVAVAFDPRGGNFRHTMYPAYKAQRPPMPDDLAVQWPAVFQVTQAFGLPLIQLDGFEADDVIATLARAADLLEWKVTIVSSDKDLMQLVNTRIQMLDTMKKKCFDPQAVCERWGVNAPAQVHDLLALAGDSSDNIPGIPGIGPKTAAQLICKYGDMESVLAHAGEIKQPKRRENLIQYADDARLAWRLVKLREDAPVGITLDELAVQPPDAATLSSLFRALEFRALFKEFNEAQAEGTANDHDAVQAEASNTPIRHQVVDTEDALNALILQLEQAALIAIDTETTSLICHSADLVGISLAVRVHEAWYIPVGHRAEDMLSEKPKQLPIKQVLDALRPILENPEYPKCGHNLKYDMQILKRAGIRLAGIRYDSMLLAYSLYPGKYPPSLDQTAEDYLHHHCISYADVAGKGAKQRTFDQVAIAQAAPYAAEDAEVSLRLTQFLKTQLEAENRLNRHDDIELALLSVLAEMEWTGVGVDAPVLHSLSTEFGQRIGEIEQEIHQAAGCTFNIQSPKQLGKILFDNLGLPSGKKTKSGQWATGQAALESLAETHLLPRLVLQVRQLIKLKSTYADALVRLIHPDTKRVHTSYNQAITTTGRLSSSDPNLQNIPIRTAEGRRIRKAFIAAQGQVLISADYSQIELRLMAHFSADAALTHAFTTGQDIHIATAAAVNQIDIEDVTGEQRRRAKAVNFGIIYGMSAFGLAKQLGIERSDAQLFIRSYFEQYPGVRQFMDHTLTSARQQKYVETLRGHRVYIPNIDAKNGMHRAYAERTAINAPLQGSAADIIKLAMIRVHHRLKQAYPEAHLILQVHDELVVEAPEAIADSVVAVIKEEMEQAVSLNVPLIVDIGIAKNWLEAHAL